eukprot:1150698-Pelagomonas_calceolata.AAC.2
MPHGCFLMMKMWRPSPRAKCSPRLDPRRSMATATQIMSQSLILRCSEAVFQQPPDAVDRTCKQNMCSQLYVEVVPSYILFYERAPTPGTPPSSLKESTHPIGAPTAGSTPFQQPH